MERETYITLFRFETSSEAEQERLVEQMTALGGAVVSGEHCIERIPEAHEISQYWFEEAVKKRDIDKKWTSRYWKTLVDIHQNMLHDMDAEPDNKVDFLDLRLIRLSLLKTEQGHRQGLPLGVGQKLWDILADIINPRCEDVPDLLPLIPWDNDIHSRFSARTVLREKAVSDLSERYRHLETDATGEK